MMLYETSWVVVGLAVYWIILLILLLLGFKLTDLVGYSWGVNSVSKQKKALIGIFISMGVVWFIVDLIANPPSGFLPQTRYSRSEYYENDEVQEVEFHGGLTEEEAQELDRILNAELYKHNEWHRVKTVEYDVLIWRNLHDGDELETFLNTQAKDGWRLAWMSDGYNYKVIILSKQE